MGRVLVLANWGGGKVCDGKMGVWVQLGGGQKSFRVLIRAR